MPPAASASAAVAGGAGATLRRVKASAWEGNRPIGRCSDAVDALRPEQAACYDRPSLRRTGDASRTPRLDPHHPLDSMIFDWLRPVSSDLASTRYGHDLIYVRVRAS